jgi:hypothetical protein
MAHFHSCKLFKNLTGVQNNRSVNCIPASMHGIERAAAFSAWSQSECFDAASSGRVANEARANCQENGVIVVGTVFAEEAKTVAAQHGARIVALHKVLWTDESARARQR